MAHARLLMNALILQLSYCLSCKRKYKDFMWFGVFVSFTYSAYIHIQEQARLYPPLCCGFVAGFCFRQCLLLLLSSWLLWTQALYPHCGLDTTMLVQLWGVLDWIKKNNNKNQAKPNHQTMLQKKKQQKTKSTKNQNITTATKKETK